MPVETYVGTVIDFVRLHQSWAAPIILVLALSLLMFGGLGAKVISWLTGG